MNSTFCAQFQLKPPNLFYLLLSYIISSALTVVKRWWRRPWKCQGLLIHSVIVPCCWQRITWCDIAVLHFGFTECCNSLGNSVVAIASACTVVTALVMASLALIAVSTVYLYRRNVKRKRGQPQRCRGLVTINIPWIHRVHKCHWTANGKQPYIRRWGHLWRDP